MFHLINISTITFGFSRTISFRSAQSFNRDFHGIRDLYGDFLLIKYIFGKITFILEKIIHLIKILIHEISSTNTVQSLTLFIFLRSSRYNCE